MPTIVGLRKNATKSKKPGLLFPQGRPASFSFVFRLTCTCRSKKPTRRTNATGIATNSHVSFFWSSLTTQRRNTHNFRHTISLSPALLAAKDWAAQIVFSFSRSPTKIGEMTAESDEKTQRSPAVNQTLGLANSSRTLYPLSYEATLFFVRMSVLLSLLEGKEKITWLGMIPTRASLQLSSCFNPSILSSTFIVFSLPSASSVQHDNYWGEPQASPTVTCWLGFLSRYIYKYIYISTGRPLSLIQRPASR